MTHSSTAEARARLAQYPIRIRRLDVLGTEYVTPRMLRMRLGGDGLAGFESHAPDEHVKILFPERDGRLRLPEQDHDHLDWPRPMPVNREYTVRRYTREAGELWLDFAVHEGGLASDWACGIEAGAPVWVAGPPRGWIVPGGGSPPEPEDRYAVAGPEFDFFVLLGDETALPAIARRLEELPESARGVAVIEVADAGERQELVAPHGVDVRWRYRNGVEAGTTRTLAVAAQSIAIPADAVVYLWAAGETHAVKPLRRWAKELGLGKGQAHITGYWRRGLLGDVRPGAQGAASRLSALLGR
ncbi:MAG: siderophore-interacting protein [Leucobacter sp.]